MKKHLLKKVLSVALSLTLIGSAAAILPAALPESGIEASAATYGDFEYEVSGSNVTITKYKGSSSSVSIPASINGKSVTSIGDGAFSDCTSLTSITIPEGVTKIGTYAFSSCTSLTSITIPSRVRSIKDYSFRSCWSLTSITIPSSVTSIGNGAFCGCTRLTSITIPSSVTSIGNSAFSDCTRLTSITIPDSVTRIGIYAFSCCTSLASINVDSGNMDYSSKDGVLYDKNRTVLVCCPGGKRSVTIPSGVTSIGESAFYGCTSLTSITIPSSVTSIEEWAFSGCKSLTSITIPSGVTSIGDYAFEYCTSLTSITIPSGVTSIGEGAFCGCTSLTSINVDSDNKNYSSKDGVLYNKSKTELVCCPGGKKSVVIPSGVTSIEGGAFYSCKSLTSITIPSSVTSIGNVAFYYCISLTSITIPSSVTSIGNNVFFGIINLKTIYGAKGSYAETYAKEKGISFVANEVAPTSVSLDRTELIVYKNYTKKLTATVYPSNATYKTVTWSTGNSSVATVSGGTVTGKGYGTTTITAKTCNGKTASCKVTVIVEETGVKLGSSSIEIEKGKSRTLSATVQPTNAYFKDITWTSSDTSVATVSENGVITGKNTGTTTITAETHNHNKTTCKVTVTPRVINPTSITLSKTSITMEEYDDRIITATVNPSDATDKTVTWSTSDSMVAEYYNGRIYSYLPGQATITAKTSNGITATCKVTVYTRGVVPDVIAMAGSTQLTLGKGEGTKLSASVSPSNATNKGINWRTSDSGILTVDSSGNVKAIGFGTAWITATAAGNTKLSVSCKITVRPAPKKVTLTKGVLTIGVGEKYTVGSNLDSGAACAKRTYRTSNSSVVKMTRTDWQGDFVGVKPGVAYVTVRTYNGKEAACKVTVKADPSWVKVNKSSTTISVGQTATLSAVLPDGAGAAKRTFRTSNSSIVKMNKTNWQGEFKGVKPGTAWVTVRLYNGKEASCKVTVIKPVTSVRLSSTGITLKRGETRKLTAYITPSDATNKSVTWSSSDTSVASVSGGTVTAKNPGTARITAKSHNGKTATCTVTVKAPDRQQIYSSNGVKVYYLGAFKKSDGSLRLDLQFENKSGMDSIHFSKLKDFRINNTQIKLPFGCYVSKGKTVTESIEVSSGTVSKIASSFDSSTKYKMDFEYCNAKNRSTTYSTGLKTVGKYPV